MLFNSYEFIFAFLPITFLIYFFLKSRKLETASKVFLVLSSLFFYAWWNIIYLNIIVASIIFNYSVGRVLAGYSVEIYKISKKAILTIGILGNALLLMHYKYLDFFIINLNFVFDSNVELLHLALPLAISFFTFQQIAYLVDSYRGETKEYDFLNYALFVTFFPQLIAGPIVHHKEMMTQFIKPKNSSINIDNLMAGLFIFSIGLFKKVAIADTFAIWATNGFDHSVTLHFVEAWVTSLSYTFQLYFDFSGYADMAIGAALIFNIKLPINFNSPYRATSVQDYWRRWHITFGRFLRDYIYIPLGGNRKGISRTYTNLMLTLLFAGLWHGAGWGFIIWGSLHGVALVINHQWKQFGFKMNIVSAWIITFFYINFTRVFFRATDFDDAIKVLKGMFGMNGISLYYDSFTYRYSLLYIFASFIIVLVFQNSNKLVKSLKKYHIFLMTLFFTFALLQMVYFTITGDKASEFLYFNF
ncbi:MBOAT family protein [Sulfurovum sp. bin170]|uniref:MBOAT family O-acyltransferase n=1 Tax=Sulfurovum sp. bin170 TaxID=2695268 RepID=UPI0013DF0E61|nr:MBOAT family O-acyltransferase [Sulfurovum sp. bin170]NEW60224.1 MBOAT family protein [Sulfurovum sp. bin170]